MFQVQVYQDRLHWFHHLLIYSKRKDAWNTRTKVREDTVLYHQPLFCPKCRKEYLVNVKQFTTQIVNEPDAKTQSSNFIACVFCDYIGKR